MHSKRNVCLIKTGEEFPQNDLELSTWDKYTPSPIPQNLLRGNPHNKLHVLNNEFLFTSIKSDRCIERFFYPPPHPFIENGNIHTFPRTIVRYKCMHVTMQSNLPSKKINKFPNTST